MDDICYKGFQYSSPPLLRVKEGTVTGRMLVSDRTGWGDLLWRNKFTYLISVGFCTKISWFTGIV